jgi:hypothetical protein
MGADREGARPPACSTPTMRPRAACTRATARASNDRGEFNATVRVSDRVRPGVAAAAKGFWPKPVCGDGGGL